MYIDYRTYRRCTVHAVEIVKYIIDDPPPTDYQYTIAVDFNVLFIIVYIYYSYLTKELFILFTKLNIDILFAYFTVNIIIYNRRVITKILL